MGIRLVFAGEVQVDIRHFVTAKSQEGLKGDVEAVLLKLASALRTYRIRQIRATLKALRHIKGSILAFRVRAPVMGREGVNLRDARHVRHNGRSHGTTGTDQITMLQ